jgi:hypothetical protein
MVSPNGANVYAATRTGPSLSLCLSVSHSLALSPSHSLTLSLSVFIRRQDRHLHSQRRRRHTHTTRRERLVWGRVPSQLPV